MTTTFREALEAYAFALGYRVVSYNEPKREADVSDGKRIITIRHNGLGWREIGSLPING